jgi:flagellar protein FliS
MYENVSRSYQQANFLTATPIKLILMCYDGAISSLKLARESYVAKDYETKGRALQKALDIIHELNVSLDMKKGGEISANLRALYLYMTQALIEADVKRDLVIFDEMINKLEELESGWKEIAGSHSENIKPLPYGISSVANKPVMASRAWSA